ncbi:MAG: hypothetical protein JKY22_12135 [Flavobacteriaceae bacterium]|nr:hypothetical protein [Flavobacteriaceae bacterium]PCJ26497.1 MAG: hypothetical protein COA94_05150 [Rickettsiales bacterium]
MGIELAIGGALLGSSLLGAREQRKGAQSAADAGERAGLAGIAEQRAAREAFEARTQPFLDLGLSAGEQLQGFLQDPSAGLDQINPVASFLQEQGFRQIREGGSGGGRNVDQDLSRFQTGLTSTLVPQFQQQRFNQLFNVLGLGQNAAVGQGQAALTTGGNISNLLGNIGQAQGQGAQQKAAANQGVISNIAGLAGFGFGGGFGGAPAGGGAPSGGFNALNPNLFNQSQQPNLLQSTGTF